MYAHTQIHMCMSARLRVIYGCNDFEATSQIVWCLCAKEHYNYKALLHKRPGNLGNLHLRRTTVLVEIGNRKKGRGISTESRRQRRGWILRILLRVVTERRIGVSL